jgi:hypothetical protein
MSRNFDEVLAELSMQVDRMQGVVNNEIVKVTSLNKRMDFTIKRMVMAENRLDGTDKRMIAFDEKLQKSIEALMDQNKRMEAFDKRQQESIETQAKVNQYFLDYIEKHPLNKNGYGH